MVDEHEDQAHPPEAGQVDGADASKQDEAVHADDDAHSHDAHGHGEARPAYDPHKIELPSRQPPLRETAPQSDFAMTQVVRGAIILLVGLVLTFGLGIVLA